MHFIHRKYLKNKNIAKYTQYATTVVAKKKKCR